MEPTTAGTTSSSAHGEKNVPRDLLGMARRTESADSSVPGPGPFSPVFTDPGALAVTPQVAGGREDGTAGCAVPFLMYDGMLLCTVNFVIRWIRSAPSS